MGIGSVELFQSYFSYRTQTVQVNDAYSNIENITCGVPQDNIYSPFCSSVTSMICLEALIADYCSMQMKVQSYFLIKKLMLSLKNWEKSSNLVLIG